MDIKRLIKDLTWFNLVEKLKKILNQLVSDVNNIVAVNSVTGNLVNNTDPLNPVISNNLFYSANYGFSNVSSVKNTLGISVTWSVVNVSGTDYFVSNLPYADYFLFFEPALDSIFTIYPASNPGDNLYFNIETIRAANVNGFLGFNKTILIQQIEPDLTTGGSTVSSQLTFSGRFSIHKR